MLLVLALLVLIGVRSCIGRPDDAAGPTHPYAHESWYPAWVAENATSLRMRWEPFVYWQRRPFRGRWINVDSAGQRLTPQPVAAAEARQSVWFFGGSTMWGTGQRDSATIPAVVASQLAARGVAGVRVRNFGETGYVSSQELLRLMLELRAGGHPDLVVFYDGINDAASSAMNGRCGLPQNETRRQMEFAIGRFLTLRGRFEFAEALRLMRAQASLDNGVRRLASLRMTPELEGVARGVTECYGRNVRLIEALAKTYGFRVVYFWQPTPSASPKPLTAFERAATDSTALDGLQPYLWLFNRAAARDIDAVMAPLAPGRFHNLAAIFTADTGAVWLDFVGHLTERANAVVARAMIEPIAAQLR